MRWIRESAVVLVVGGFIVAALMLALGGWLVTGWFREYPLAFDTGVSAAIREIRSPMWATLFVAVTKLVGKRCQAYDLTI